MLIYHHPVLAVRLSGRQYAHLTVAKDRLVLVSRANAQGRPQHALHGKAPLAYLAYGGTLALGRLVQDHLANNPHAPRLRRVIECDSADAVCEYALKGLGVAWLPWSMVAPSCKAGQLVVLGDAAPGDRLRSAGLPRQAPAVGRSPNASGRCSRPAEPCPIGTRLCRSGTGRVDCTPRMNGIPSAGRP